MSTFKTVLQPADVKCPPSLAHCRPHECEFTLNIGLFFDGTDNNRQRPEEVANPGLNTNVTRLWQAYLLNEIEGHFSYYVSGVGTPFYELGKKEAESFGGPGGAGGEARILYGLLQVVNSVHSCSAFFDRWVHDSYAGFIEKFKEDGGNAVHLAAEAQRYVRWRELYQGSSEGLNALLQPGVDGKAARSA